MGSIISTDVPEREKVEVRARNCEFTAEARRRRGIRESGKIDLGQRLLDFKISGKMAPKPDFLCGLSASAVNSPAWRPSPLV
jgi:hypothetical protein